jgi:hypothetical protein
VPAFRHAWWLVAGASWLGALAALRMTPRTRGLRT